MKVPRSSKGLFARDNLESRRVSLCLMDLPSSTYCNLIPLRLKNDISAAYSRCCRCALPHELRRLQRWQSAVRWLNAYPAVVQPVTKPRDPADLAAGDGQHHRYCYVAISAVAGLRAPRAAT